MSTPLIMQLPRSGLSRPIIDLRNTDLPVPDGPSSALTSPGGSVNVTSRQMFCLPKDLVRPSTTTSAPIKPPERSCQPGVLVTRATLVCNDLICGRTRCHPCNEQAPSGLLASWGNLPN